MYGLWVVHRRDPGSSGQPVGRDHQNRPWGGDLRCHGGPASVELIVFDAIHGRAVADEENGHQITLFRETIGESLESGEG